ncbi:MAG: hypothetical protein R3E34_09050 [Rhodocyclaceae bacterium]
MRFALMPSPAILTPELVRFVTSHLSIHVAASDGGGQATLVRGLGCRADPATAGGLRLLVARPQAEPVLRGIAADGRIALVFSEPETHRTVQLKARNARVGPADNDDTAVLGPYTDTLVARLGSIGTPEPFVRALLACPADELIIICATPDEVFGQTPGPQAGERLGAGQALP